MSSRHQSGWLKQSNKTHKQTHKSKRDVSKMQGGRVNHAVSVTSKATSLASKNRTARASAAANLRRNKRHAMLISRRQGGGSVGGSIGGAPRTVAVISLCQHARVPLLLGPDGAKLAAATDSVTAVFPKEKFRCTFLIPERNNLSVLDAAKAADILCFVLPLCKPDQAALAGVKKGGALEAYLSDAVDEAGRQFITLAKSQGMPAVIGILQNLDVAPAKHHSALKKQCANFFTEEFGQGTKMVVDESANELLNAMTDSNATTTGQFNGADRASMSPEKFQFLRALMETPLHHVAWRSERSYMLGCAASMEPDAADPKLATLKVAGYLRGRPLNVHQLVHIPGQGTFRMARIEGQADPHSLKPHLEQGDGQLRLLAQADPARWLETEVEAAPDMLTGDQTWPTEEEMGEEEKEAQLQAKIERAKLKKLRAKLPPGTSDYQAAWLLGMSDSEGEEDGDMDGEDDNDDDDDLGDLEADDEPKGLTLEEWKKKQKDEVDELEFPDEVETPMDISAKERFGRYRGLKSFRTSPWHPKESLPREYARIFQLGNPAVLQNQVLNNGKALEDKWLASLDIADNSKAAASGSMDTNADTSADAATEGVVNPGQWVIIHIVGVPCDLLDRLRKDKVPLVIGALLEHENKISVLNSNICKAATYEDPVKSREPLLMSCGIWRRMVRPAFSENTVNCDKHKFERFLHVGRWSVATVYAPLTFGTNVPVMLLNPTSKDLVASGSVSDLNPDRIILKKVVLSGYPIRVKKNWAVVRYMFFTPEDVRWYKPVDLWTKYGMSGRILEPVGTHGLFKCSFNKPIKNHDTICMSLYKRVFPKPVEEFKDLQAEQAAEKGANEDDELMMP